MSYDLFNDFPRLCSVGYISAVQFQLFSYFLSIKG
uniref:Uncharacterized protein n=1 Tax=Anguilla anguilla TaxID=7936 RepID=A0A0E9PDR8_ANGAN